MHVDMPPAVTAQGVFFGNVYGEPSFYRLDSNAKTRNDKKMGVIARNEVVASTSEAN